MADTGTGPVGAPVWIELGARDPDAAGRFYADVLGVEAAAPDPALGGYRRLLLHGEPVAGVMEVQPADPSGWLVYLRTDDAAATVRAAEQRGGAVALPPTEVGDLGVMALVVDPSGSTVGLWEPRAFAGTGAAGAAGSPCWYELHAGDRVAETVAFYESALGWGTTSTVDLDGSDMTVLGEGEDAVAGILDAPATGSDARGWQVYFQADDADAASSRVVESGGTILLEPTDTAFGRYLEALDPEGSRFSVLQLPDAGAV